MERHETDKLFCFLEQFYPNKRPTENQKLAWSCALEPYAYADVRAAAVAYVRENKFFPDLADLTKGLNREDNNEVYRPGQHEKAAVLRAQAIAAEIKLSRLEEML